MLVVEDQEDHRCIMRDLLSRSGYAIITAITGEEGVSLAETQHLDLILMDIPLPVIDGDEAARRMKTHPARQHMPIRAVTSDAFSGDDVKAFAADCNA